MQTNDEKALRKIKALPRRKGGLRSSPSDLDYSESLPERAQSLSREVRALAVDQLAKEKKV